MKCVLMSWITRASNNVTRTSIHAHRVRDNDRCCTNAAAYTVSYVCDIIDYSKVFFPDPNLGELKIHTPI